MDRGLFRYDEPSGRPRRKANLFGWTIAILLLCGLAFATWLGSYYVFNQPERPDSYKLLKRLHKIEQPKRFQLTAAPAGEFLDPRKLHERFGSLHGAELAKVNADLIRNFIHNYQQVRGLVPYVVGRFTIMDTHELGPNDLFTSGMATLSSSVDYGEVLLEHIYPADAQATPLMKQTLVPGLEIKLERVHDLSAVIHAERLGDGRLLLTVVPLLYGSYTVTQGRGAFSLEPPFELNMAAGFPLFKAEERKAAETAYASYRQKTAPSLAGIPLPGLGPSATPVAQNALVQVEAAIPVQPLATPLPAQPTPAVVAKKTKGKPGKGEKTSPTPAVAKASPASSPVVAAAATPPLVRQSPAPAETSTPALAMAVPTPTAAATPAIQPVSGEMALASTAGGGTWKTYPAGKMPVGRLITTADLHDLADRGVSGERIYLRGQFTVNFTETNRAVLRPKAGMAESVLHLGGSSATRIIVEFPEGSTPPAQGSTVNRDQARPYEITEVRKQSDGQLNVFVREIMQ